MKGQEVFLLMLDRMLVHRRSLPHNLSGFPNNFAGAQLYSWVERGTVRVKCLAQEYNTVSPARAQTWTVCGLLRDNAILESDWLSSRPCIYIGNKTIFSRIQSVIMIGIS